MMARVPSFGHRCANFFTGLKLISYGGIWASQPAGAAGRTSGPEDSSLRQESYEAYERSVSGRLLEVEPSPLQARSGFPAGSALPLVKHGVSLPASRLRLRLRTWRTPGTPCPYRRGCERKQGSPMAVEPIAVARLRTYPRSWQTSP